MNKYIQLNQDVKSIISTYNMPFKELINRERYVLIKQLKFIHKTVNSLSENGIPRYYLYILLIKRHVKLKKKKKN